MSENDTRDRERLEELREKMQLRQLTEEDKDEAGGFKDGQEELFDLDPEEEEFDEIDKAYRGEELQWLADRGLCSWSEAVEYFAGPFVPQPEYERVMRNYAPVNCGARFTVCGPNERSLLEVLKCGHGPNSSEGWAVVHAGESHYLVRVGPP